MAKKIGEIKTTSVKSPLKTLYIVRHGQTELNRLGIVQGRGRDTDLNEEGRKQAGQFFEAYKNVHFNKIYISLLKRTQQSIQQFIDLGKTLAQKAFRQEHILFNEKNLEKGIEFFGAKSLDDLYAVLFLPQPGCINPDYFDPFLLIVI